MVSINGVEMPLTEMSGVIVLEDPSGNQQWALITDATIEYGDADFRTEGPQMKVVATMKPGELLRMVSTEEQDEGDIFMYTKLLTSVWREAKDRREELTRENARLLREMQSYRRQLDQVRRLLNPEDDDEEDEL